MGKVLKFPRIVDDGRDKEITPLFFLSRAFAGRRVRQAQLRDKEAVLIFDPPNHSPIDQTKASHIKWVEVGRQRFKVERIDQERSGLMDLWVEKEKITGWPVLILSIERKETSDVTFESPNVIFHTDFGLIRVPGVGS